MQTHTSMHVVLAERVRKQPENTPATRHFAKHCAHMHICAHTHTELSLCRVALAPQTAGRFFFFARVCFSILRKRKKKKRKQGTQTRAREQQPNSAALRLGLSVSLRTR